MTDSVTYTPEEVAKLFKISRFTVYEMIKRGDLAAYRIGRKVRIEARDLETYIERTKSTVPVQSSTPQATVHDGFIICGQDIILDILTRHLERAMPNVNFLRNHSGSIAGLIALYQGTADATAAHLWDSDSNGYNLPYVRRLLPGHRTLIINLAYRTEGFYVAAGNPKNASAWTDLAKPDIRFVNRERGSGARVLLDEQLRVHNIEPSLITGYDREEMSHLAVASCVARGEADVGLGIEKAALQVANLEFIPLQKERYDLVLRKADCSKPMFKTLLSILRSPSLHDELRGMGGYDLSHLGQVMAET